MPEAATAEPPVQQQQQAEAPKTTFQERIAAARAATQAKGLEVSDGVEAPVVEKVVQSTDGKEAKAKESKVEEKKTPEKKAEAKESKSPLAEAMTKIREGKLEEAKPEAKTEEKVDLSKLTAEQKKEHTFKELREKADKYDDTQKQLEELRTKLNGTDLDALKKELEDTKKVVDEKERKLAAVDVIESPKYQREVAQPLEAILKDFSEASKEFGYSMRDFMEAVENPNKRERELALSKVLGEAEKELNPITQVDLLSSINEYRQRREFGAALLQNSTVAREALKREEAQKQEQAKKESESEFTRVSGIVFDHIINDDVLKKEMPFLLNDNQKLDDIKAKEIRDSAAYGDTPAHIRALQAYSTAILPMALEHVKTLSKQLQERDARIKELSDSSPEVKQGSQEDAGASDSNIPFSQKIAAIRQRQARG